MGWESLLQIDMMHLEKDHDGMEAITSTVDLAKASDQVQAIVVRHRAMYIHLPKRVKKSTEGTMRTHCPRPKIPV